MKFIQWMVIGPLFWWGLGPQEGFSASNVRCQQRWQKILADGNLEIVISLGYSDALLGGQVLVNDTLYRSIVVNKLEAPCTSPDDEVCGFTLLKTDTWAKQHEGVNVFLHLTDSSVTLSDTDNRRKYAQKQQQKSQQALASFLAGIAKADVVFYQGHSRAGGGPDFYPPKLRPDLEVDYAWYWQKKSGIGQVLSTLKRPGRKAQILGLFSCDSQRHFQHSLQAVAPDLSLILTLDLVEQEWVQSAMIGALNAILGGQCANGVEKLARFPGRGRPIVHVDNF